MMLRTERLLLRELTEADWPAVLAYQRDPRYLRYYAWTDRTEAEVRAFLQPFIEWQHDEPRSRYQLAIVLGKELIGIIGLRRAASEAPVAEIGFELAPAHWGSGYATEAARALLAFGFGRLGLHRVAAHCVADNTASSRVLERLGMKLEGRLRESEYFKDRWWDTLLYGILAREWEGSETVRGPPPPPPVGEGGVG